MWLCATSKPTLDMVLPRLFLSCADMERQREALDARGITHVLQVGTGLRPSHPGSFSYLHHACWDDPSEDLLSFFPGAFAFMDEGISQGGVLVHCMAGVSRSATVCIGYVMWKKRASFDEALQLVRSARGIVSPNVGFWRQLQNFERVHHCNLDALQQPAPAAAAPAAAAAAAAPMAPRKPGDASNAGAAGAAELVTPAPSGNAAPAGEAEPSPR